MASRVRPRRLMTGVYWFPALEFALGAITKYWPGETFFGPPYSTQFVEWGYPSWMRFVAGPTHIINHDGPAESWAASTHLVIVGIRALAD